MGLDWTDNTHILQPKKVSTKVKTVTELESLTSIQFFTASHINLLLRSVGKISLEIVLVQNYKLKT